VPFREADTVMPKPVLLKMVALFTLACASPVERR
jgi:hypothetical protein